MSVVPQASVLSRRLSLELCDYTCSSIRKLVPIIYCNYLRIGNARHCLAQPIGLYFY